MNDDHIILGIHIGDRLKKAADVQKVFTEYGCNIKTRIGLHDVDDRACSPSGVVLIEFFGSGYEARIPVTSVEEALTVLEKMRKVAASCR